MTEISLEKRTLSHINIHDCIEIPKHLFCYIKTTYLPPLSHVTHVPVPPTCVEYYKYLAKEEINSLLIGKQSLPSFIPISDQVSRSFQSFNGVSSLFLSDLFPGEPFLDKDVSIVFYYIFFPSSYVESTYKYISFSFYYYYYYLIKRHFFYKS